MWFQALKSDSVPENRIFPHLTEDWNWLSTPALYIYIYIYIYIYENCTSRHFDPESWVFSPFAVIGAAGVLTRVFKSRLTNCESVVVTQIHPILSPEYLRWREASYKTFEVKRWIISNRLILELRIDFRRTWVYN